MRLYLIGLPGSGKTRIGKKLSKVLNLEFLDLDQEFQKVYNRTPNEAIREDGEERFRILESEILRETKNFDGVISTGGGIVVKGENKHFMRGLVIYLEIAPDLIKLSDDEISSRPILEEKGLLKLFMERECAYLGFSDLIITIDHKSDDEVIREIIKKIWKY